MTAVNTIADIRREYGELSLNEQSIHDDPIAQFNAWFAEIMQEEINDPTAMVLSTVDEQGYPDSRVVLLKGIDAGRFIFYTNYQSSKGVQIAHNPHAALNFYWPQMSRQVRIRGILASVAEHVADSYFSSRPKLSQLAAIISPQSKIIPNRLCLEEALTTLLQDSVEELPTRPKQWGGYQLDPHYIEFWQGRDNRLHDRIAYCRQEQEWAHHRLAP